MTELPHETVTNPEDDLPGQIAAHLTTAFAANKTKLFAKLSEAGITLVRVNYDGSGDEGNIGEIEYYINDVPTTPPQITLPYHLSRRQDIKRLDLDKFLEELSFDFVLSLYEYWEDGEGAYGTIEFTTATQAITLQHLIRVIDYITEETIL